MSTIVQLTYWSDPLCIWAYLAQDKVDRLVARFPDALEVHERVVPVFGSLPKRFDEGSWAARGREGRMEDVRSVASRFGHDEVSGRCFVDDTPASSWSPAIAAEAVALAEEAGDVPTGSTGRFLQAVRRAFFVDDRNVSRRGVQEEVASALGLAWAPLETRIDDGRALARLWEDHEARQALGIQGSPSFVFDEGRIQLYGNASERVLQATVGALLEGEGGGGSRC